MTVPRTKPLDSQSAFLSGALVFSILVGPVSSGYSPVRANTLTSNRESDANELSYITNPLLTTVDSSPLAFPITSLKAGTTSAWFAAGLSKIDGMQNLRRGWDGYQAEPPNASTIEQARFVLQMLYRMNFEPNRIAASAEGGIAIAFYTADRYGDVEMLNSGEVLAITSIGDGNPNAWKVEGNSQVKEALGKIRDYIRLR